MADNAIASALMRKLLETVVTSRDGQLRTSLLRDRMLTPVAWDDISAKLFHQRDNTTCILAAPGVMLLNVAHPQIGLHAGCSV